MTNSVVCLEARCLGIVHRCPGGCLDAREVFGMDALMPPLGVSGNLFRGVSEQTEDTARARGE